MLSVRSFLTSRTPVSDFVVEGYPNDRRALSELTAADKGARTTALAVSTNAATTAANDCSTWVELRVQPSASGSVVLVSEIVGEATVVCGLVSGITNFTRLLRRKGPGFLSATLKSGKRMARRSQHHRIASIAMVALLSVACGSPDLRNDRQSQTPSRSVCNCCRRASSTCVAAADFSYAARVSPSIAGARRARWWPSTR